MAQGETCEFDEHGNGKNGVSNCRKWTCTYCGDEELDEENGETCDSGDHNGESGYCNDQCNGTVE